MSESGAWDGRRILVTGARGFIGSWLTLRLLELGAAVVTLERPARQPSCFTALGLEGRCREHPARLEDLDSLVGLIEDHSVDAVFHLAAHALVQDANETAAATFETNVAGTWNVLEACRMAGGVERIVVASSDKAYGHHERMPLREEDALAPVFPYEASKAAADVIARSYHAAFGLPVVVGRLANVYGPGDFAWSRIVPGTIRALITGGRPVLRSDGSAERDLLYASDAAEAYVALAEAADQEGVAGTAFNAGPERPISMREVVRRLTGISGRDVEPLVEGAGTPTGEIDRIWLDASRIRAQLGWRPRVSIDEGLATTFAWYEDHQDLWAASGAARAL